MNQKLVDKIHEVIEQEAGGTYYHLASRIAIRLQEEGFKLVLKRKASK